jgi:hypothetical protein
MESYNLFVENYYDNLSEDYYQIISINKFPKGELSKYVRKMSIKKISSDNPRNTKYCSYVISSQLILNNSNNLNNLNNLNICTVEDVNEVYEFLVNNNYYINNEFNKCLKLNKNLDIFDSKRLIFSFYYKIDK